MSSLVFITNVEFQQNDRYLLVRYLCSARSSSDESEAMSEVGVGEDTSSEEDCDLARGKPSCGSSEGALNFSSGLLADLR